MKRTNRNLAQELMDSLGELGAHREGKITLRTRMVEAKPPVQVSATLIKRLRERLKVSQGVLARKLRVKVRTLEKWEHSKTPLKGAAALLIALVEQFPDTLERLDSIDVELLVADAAVNRSPTRTAPSARTKARKDRESGA